MAQSSSIAVEIKCTPLKTDEEASVRNKGEGDNHLTVLVPHAGLKAGADMGVGPHVHGLLLAPHELSIGVAPQLPLNQIKGKGHQLQCSKQAGYTLDCELYKLVTVSRRALP